MADQVPEEVKADRNRRILDTATRVGAARSQRLEGRTFPVLVDGVSRKNAGEAAGRTRCNRVVNFDPRGRDLLGRVVPVRVVRALPHSLRGELEA
jgi:tRNA-2-methylthio-N6-dimethylallyladenosine synthase